MSAEAITFLHSVLKSLAFSLILRGKNNCLLDCCATILSHVKRLLIKNTEVFQYQNVLEHPGLFIQKIAATNQGTLERTSLDFAYLSTVFYASIAYIFGITNNENNALDLLLFLEMKE